MGGPREPKRSRSTSRLGDVTAAPRAGLSRGPIWVHVASHDEGDGSEVGRARPGVAGERAFGGKLRDAQGVGRASLRRVGGGSDGGAQGRRDPRPRLSAGRGCPRRSHGSCRCALSRPGRRWPRLSSRSGRHRSAWLAGSMGRCSVWSSGRCEGRPIDPRRRSGLRGTRARLSAIANGRAEGPDRQPGRARSGADRLVRRRRPCVRRRITRPPLCRRVRARRTRWPPAARGPSHSTRTKSSASSRSA